MNRLPIAYRTPDARICGRSRLRGDGMNEVADLLLRRPKVFIEIADLMPL